MGNVSRGVVGVCCLVSSALLLATGPAHAFCRTHSCETLNSCEVREGCLVGGATAFWPSACLTYAIQNSGSPKLGLDAGQVATVVTEEFGRWAQATCPDGGLPVFIAQSRGDVACQQPEYNCAHDNVNVVMFQDQEWVHGSFEVALTTVTMNTVTGKILDADVEVNTAQYDFQLDAPVASDSSWDLRVVLAHELGHVLGLSHSNDNSALMREGGKATPDLAADDVLGVCAIYPPGNPELACPAPPPADGECHGTQFSCPRSREEEESGCACSLPDAQAPSRGWPLGLLTLLVSRRWLRRRMAGFTAARPRAVNPASGVR